MKAIRNVNVHARSTGSLGKKRTPATDIDGKKSLVERKLVVVKVIAEEHMRVDWI